jgi:pimeloyl-ACP methyl ester carboxylesterase
MTATALSPDGFSIAYETLGEGSPALVFVHGWSCDRSYWAAQLEPFSRDFRVVAVDLAGQGELPNAAIDQVSRPRPAARRSCSCRGSAISS